MKMNMGNIDRFTRGLIAIGLIVLNIKGIITGGVAVAAIIVAVVFMLTSLIGFCPAYSIFSYSTRKIDS